MLRPIYYYAVVWSTTLKEKNSLIKGTLVTKHTKLPDDPRMMYGNNGNDVFKIKVPRVKEVVSYDTFTTTQKVRFEVDIESYEIFRDARIILWENYDELDLRYDRYKVVSLEMLNEIIKDAHNLKVEKDEEFENVNELTCYAESNPERFLKKKVLNSAGLSLKFN